LDRRFVERLHPQTRRNIAAVGRIRLRLRDAGVQKRAYATGFVVHNDDGHPLMLTNCHVAHAEGMTREPRIALGDGSRARIARVLSSDRLLDYALVELEMAPGASGPAPIPLATVRPSGPVYLVSAGALIGNLADQGRQDEIATNRRSAARIAAAASARPLPLIAGGLPTSQVGITKDATTGQLAWVRHYQLTSTHGGSGSPLIDRTTHAAVGMANSGLGPRDERGIDVAVILQNVKIDLKLGKIHPGSRARVQRLLDANAVPDQPALVAKALMELSARVPNGGNLGEFRGPPPGRSWPR
jgi:hypothetical protein